MCEIHYINIWDFDKHSRTQFPRKHGNQDVSFMAKVSVTLTQTSFTSHYIVNAFCFVSNCECMLLVFCTRIHWVLQRPARLLKYLHRHWVSTLWKMHTRDISMINLYKFHFAMYCNDLNLCACQRSVLPINDFSISHQVLPQFCLHMNSRYFSWEKYFLMP